VTGFFYGIVYCALFGLLTSQLRAAPLAEGSRGLLAALLVP